MVHMTGSRKNLTYCERADSYIIVDVQSRFDKVVAITIISIFDFISGSHDRKLKSLTYCIHADFRLVIQYFQL